MHLNFEKKTKLIVLGFTLIVILIIAGTIWPVALDIYHINNDTLKLRTYLEQKYKSAVDLRQSSEKIESAKQQTATFSTALYKTGDELKLITLLENLATKHSLNQRILAPNLDKPQNQTIKITLNINGKYRDVLEYLSELEVTPYFLITNRIQMAGITGSANRNVVVAPASDIINMDLDLQMYVSI